MRTLYLVFTWEKVVIRYDFSVHFFTFIWLASAIIFSEGSTCSLDYSSVNRNATSFIIFHVVTSLVLPFVFMFYSYGLIIYNHVMDTGRSEDLIRSEKAVTKIFMYSGGLSWLGTIPYFCMNILGGSGNDLSPWYYFISHCLLFLTGLTVPIFCLSYKYICMDMSGQWICCCRLRKLSPGKNKRDSIGYKCLGKQQGAADRNLSNQGQNVEGSITESVSSSKKCVRICLESGMWTPQLN